MYRSVNRNHWLIVAIWGAVFLLCLSFALSGFGAGKVWNRTNNQPSSVPGSESYTATQVLEENSSSNYQVYLLVTGVDMEKQSQETANVLSTATKNLLKIPGVVPAGVLHPYAAGTDAKESSAKQLMDGFIAQDKQGFLLVVLLDLTQFPERSDEIRELTETTLSSVAQDLRSFASQAKGLVTDSFIENKAVSAQASSDFTLAYTITLGLLLVVLVLTLGNLRLAAIVFLTSLVGLVLTRAIVNLASLFVSPNPEDPALVTMLSLGIVTGYGVTFLMRARAGVAIVKYTAEIPAVAAEKALQRRVRRNVAGSALEKVFAHTAVAVGWSTGLIILGLATVSIFPATSLRWVAVVSIISMLGSLAVGITFTPSMIYATSRWLELPTPRWYDRLWGKFWASWARLGESSRRLWRRLPHVSALGTFVAAGLLLLACLPVWGISWHTAAATDVPGSSDSGKFHALRAAEYGQTAAEPDLQVLARTAQGELSTWATQVSSLKGVASTIVDPSPYGNYMVLDIQFTPDISNRDAMKLTKQIRDLETDFPKLVTGQAANQIDFGTKILRYVPGFMVPLMFFATVLILARATRRATASLVAGVLNTVLVTASLGLTALVFQDGILSWLPVFSRTGGVEPSVAVLLVGYGFALALDHQLYALNRQRIKLPAGIEDDTYLSELSRSRSVLWLRTTLILVSFLAFLPTHLQAVKQAAFAMVVVILLNSLFNRLLLSPMLAPYPDQLRKDSGLIWLT